MKISYWYIALFVFIVVIVAVILHPSDVRESWMLYQSRQLNKAYTKLNELYEKNPDNYRVLKQYATLLETMGRVEKASTIYQQLLKQRPTDKNFESIHRFYMWTQQPIKAQQTLEQWYSWRKTQKWPIDKRDEQKLLADLYAHLLLAQEYEKAIPVLKKRIKLDPDDDDFRKDLITLFEKAGDLNTTMRLLEEFLKKHPQDDFALVKMVNLAPMAGKTKEAERFLLASINKDRENRDSWDRLIYFETRLKQYNTANGYFKQWMRMFPDNWGLKKRYVNWLIGTEQLDIALVYLEPFADESGTDPFYKKTLINIYEWKSMYDKLLPIYMGRYEEDPHNTENNKKLIDVLFALKKDDLLFKVVSNLLSLNPNDPKYIKLMADIYMQKEDTKEVIALLERLYNITKDPKVAKQLGEYYLFNGMRSEAFELFMKHFDSLKNDPDIYKYLGEIEVAQNNYEEAITYFNQYTEMRPNDYYGYYRLGEIYTLRKEKTKAMDELLTAKNLIQTEKKDLFDEVNEARIYSLLGENNEAMIILEGLVIKHPNNKDISYAYIESLINAKDYEKASVNLAPLEGKYPSDTEVLRLKSRLLIGEKKYSEAEEILKGLTARYPERDDFKIDLAYLYLDTGDWFKAYPMFVGLSDKYPKDTGLVTARNDLFKAYRPQIRGGFSFTKIGSENRYGPYIKYKHPINTQWGYGVDYRLDQNTANIPGYDTDFSEFVNFIDMMGDYHPHRYVTIAAGISNQIGATKYYPAPHLIFDWKNPVYGNLNLDFIYNRILDDPTNALYFDGTTDRLGLYYEKSFIERIIFNTRYHSNWYRVDGDKVGRGGGSDFGRDDIAGAGIMFMLHLKPDIQLGYDYQYSKLHIVNNYLDVIPLIEKSKRHGIIAGFFHDWNKYFSTDLYAFVGDDHPRQLYLKDLDLYGFSFTPQVKVSKRLEFIGHYEYSSEDIQNNVGRYWQTYLEVLYRF